MMEENKKVQEFLMINDEYRLTSDGSRNLILQQRYEKRDGKGKNAPLSGVFEFKDVGYFGAGLSSLIHRFEQDEFMSTFSDSIKGQEILEALRETQQLMKKQHKELLELIRPNITLELKNVKDSAIKDEVDE